MGQRDETLLKHINEGCEGTSYARGCAESAQFAIRQANMFLCSADEKADSPRDVELMLASADDRITEARQQLARGIKLLDEADAGIRAARRHMLKETA